MALRVVAGLAHKKRQEAPSAKTPALSLSDKAGLQRSIDRLRDAHKTISPAGFLTSEGTAMLCASPTDIYDRLNAFLSNIAIVSGLVLSSIASAALEPLDPEDFEGEKRALAEAINVTAALTVVVQLMVVLFSTYTLYMVIAHVHNSTAAYRATLHMTRWLGFLEFCSYLPALGFLALVVLHAFLWCSELAWIVLGSTIATWAGFQVFFDVMTSHATPFAAWQWALPTGYGIGWLSGRMRAAVKREGELLSDQAKEGVLGGLDEDDDFVIDGMTSAVQTSKEEEELASWLQDVLSVTPTAAGLFAERLFAAGLTCARMPEATKHPGGFQSLCEMLSFSELGLRPGERLALASAAMGKNVAPQEGRRRRKAPSSQPEQMRI